MAKKKKSAPLAIIGVPVFQTIRKSPWSSGRESQAHGVPTIVLQNGVSLYALSDPEGNGFGALFGSDAEGDFRLAGDQRDAFLKGRKITAVSKLKQSVMNDMMWDGEPPAVLEFEGGIQIYASRDEEGNGPGTLIAQEPGGREFYIFGQGPKDWSPR